MTPPSPRSTMYRAGGAPTIEVALEVGGEDRLERIVGVFPELPVALHTAAACVRDHHVDGPEGIHATVDHGVHLRRVGHVRDPRHRVTAVGADLRHGLVDLGARSGGHQHVGPGLGQRLRHGATEAAPAAGHHGTAASEGQIFEHRDAIVTRIGPAVAAAFEGKAGYQRP